MKVSNDDFREYLQDRYSTPEEAFKAYEKGARGGDPAMKTRLGMCHLFHIGTEKNQDSAFRWLNRAADQGYPEGQCYLGFMYYWGLGPVSKDKRKAADLYEKAAEAGYVDAMMLYAECCMAGEGMDADPQLGIEWFEKAAEAGDSYGQHLLAREYISGENTAKDMAKGLQLMEKSAAQGNTDALYDLGQMYEKGIGVKQDLEAAKGCYLEADRLGHPEAQKSAADVLRRLYGNE